MNTKLFLSLALVVLSALTGLAQDAQSAQAPRAENAMPKFDMETYQFGILRRGPKWEAATDANKEALTKLQAGHMANIEKMAAMGKLYAAGPMAGTGEIRGIFVFKVGSIEAAQTLAAVDPMIQAGHLKLDLYTWMGPKGIGEKFLEEYKKDPKTKTTMTKFYLALLMKGDEKIAATAALQREHLWYIRNMMDAKTFVAAGPFVGNGEIRGIFIIAAPSPEEALAIAQRDPQIKAGRLVPQMHTWWVAKEVWP